MGKIMKYGVEYSGAGGGGGDANDTELTWDEYQELTEEEKNNGTNYYITDVNSDGMDGRFQPVMYSTKERIIGVWTNGKPLYERCLQAEESVIVYGDRDQSFSVSGITNKYVNEILPTLDKITKAELICNNEDNYYYNYPIGFLHGNGQFKRIDSPNVAWIGSRVIGGSYLVLQYTKTTDGAGSGQWTPQGVPACHYSTDEHVVGTWVDGNTLYERTYTGIGITGTSDTTIVDANIKSNSGIYNVKSITGLWSIGTFGYSNATTQAFGEPGIVTGGSQTVYARVTPNGLAVVRTNTNFGCGALLTVRYTKTTD